MPRLLSHNQETICREEKILVKKRKLGHDDLEVSRRLARASWRVTTIQGYRIRKLKFAF
jgi:hypothetical protein